MCECSHSSFCLRFLVRRYGVFLATLLCQAFFWASKSWSGESSALAQDDQFQQVVAPLLERYCSECHGSDRAEAEVDLSRLATLHSLEERTGLLVRVRQMMDTGQMPPPESEAMDDADRMILLRWLKDYLTAEAAKRAGDPGEVVLRRLSNAEYNYTLQDLTGLPSLDPTREFPVDGAAGEGFTNTGAALVMSPSLVTKYLDAAKQVADHLVLLPDGVRFSEFTTRRDRTDELMARIQAFYRQFTDDGGGSAVNLQGIEFTTNQGGRLPIERYLLATLNYRDALRSGQATIETVAANEGLNVIYLHKVWNTLQSDSPLDSFLLERVRRLWQQGDGTAVDSIRAEIEKWQQAVWKFNAVGQLGREGSPSVWMEPVDPVVAQHEIRLKFPDLPDGQQVVLYLTANDAGDGHEGDYVVWKRPRIEGAGQPHLDLRDALGWQERVTQLRQQMLEQTEAYLRAADAVQEAVERNSGAELDLQRIADSHHVDAKLLPVWLDYLGLGVSGQVAITGHFTQTLKNQAGYAFINGWGLPETPSVIANSSDQEVRIPGLARPHSLVVHPAPTQYVAIGWRSPISGRVGVEMHLAHAHPECGNGIEWVVQHRTRTQSVRLGGGEVVTAASGSLDRQEVELKAGDVISLFVGPRQGDHGCDLTQAQMLIRELDGEQRVWDLAKDLSSNILDANPHADSLGNAGVWHLYRGEMAELQQSSANTQTVPAGSLLAHWKAATSQTERTKWGQAVQQLVRGTVQPAPESADAILLEQIRQLPLPPDHPALIQETPADGRFGSHPLGGPVDSRDLHLRAPAVLEFRLPAALVRGRELIVTGMLDEQHGQAGSVQCHASFERPSDEPLRADWPLIVRSGGKSEERIRRGLDAFRTLFPPTVCYSRIVPVDEVVTLLLFYREDQLLQDLMLDESQKMQLHRLWDELLYVTQEPLQLEVSFEQIREFATQDRPDLVVAFKSLVEPIASRANEFRQRLIETQPAHVEGLVRLADRAWRRPLTELERQSIRTLYANLRAAELSHEEAIRLTFARMMTSPAFLYKREQPSEAMPSGPVTNHELASRLSYFLWSSLPDEELREAADAGKLTADEGTELLQQTQRMLRDAKTRRLAIHFASQWLHVRDFDQNDEKNEKLFPEFADLRDDMYEETVRFFDDMFRENGSVLSYLNADHTFLNETLAHHYGIEGVHGPEWRKVQGISTSGRGGVLGMATVLASQSGASRTSPILRGNWVSETLLGERLPKPPANVPQLPEEVPAGLNERQLIERHSSDPACAKCHKRIDPYGFSLEQYDAIGRMRPMAMDTRTTLLDGKAIDGLKGLRDYLTRDRHDDVLRQFCRKLLGYALGREVQFSDEPLLVEMQERLVANDYRFRVAVETIVMSPQFRNIRGDASELNREATSSSQP